MALPIIPGVVRIIVKGQVPSTQQFANIWHARYTGGASSPGASDITALDALFTRLYSGTAFAGGAGWLTECVPTVTVYQISYVLLDGTSLGQDIGKSLAGSAATPSTPSECAPVLTLRTAQRGKSHRGRIYLPCPATAVTDTAGRLTGPTASKMVAQLTGLMAALGGPSVAPFWEMGVASYKLGVFTPLSNPTMDLDVDVQRRRKK